MKIREIIWLDEIVEKLITKHKINQNEVLEVFLNKPYLRFVEKGHYSGENVYSALSKTDNGRYLIVFFIHKKNKKALILSARDMTKNERKRYEKR
ncbi:MAG: BrnT family toxin [Candidatus Cloacimonetes bacterium]|nr:BrnT family toxin [Candidatus Cloacimonadota bacterium]